MFSQLEQVSQLESLFGQLRTSLQSMNDAQAALVSARTNAEAVRGKICKVLETSQFHPIETATEPIALPPATDEEEVPVVVPVVTEQIEIAEAQPLPDVYQAPQEAAPEPVSARFDMSVNTPAVPMSHENFQRLSAIPRAIVDAGVPRGMLAPLLGIKLSRLNNIISGSAQTPIGFHEAMATLLAEAKEAKAQQEATHAL